MQSEDADAFAELYDRYAVMSYSLASQVCGRNLAEDATQAAFLAVWRSRAQYSSRHGAFKTWLLTIVRNRAIDAYRKNGTDRDHRSDLSGEPDELQAGLDSLPSPRATEPDVMAREQAAEIQLGLDGLPDSQCKVIELAFFGGFAIRRLPTASISPQAP